MNRTIHFTLLLSIAVTIFACSAPLSSDEDTKVHLPSATKSATQSAAQSSNQPATQSAILTDTQSTPFSSSLTISEITDNASDYPNGQVTKYDKFEISFRIEGSVAGNYQFPYDPSPPPGIDLENPVYQGITVNALFTPDHWKTTYIQPAFYYQDFIQDIQRGRDWIYPTVNYTWKARFSPHQPGQWQYKLQAKDASGMAETGPFLFTVSDSTNPGFVRVSQNDSRYFEFDNGKIFNGLGYNMNFNAVSWISPIQDNEPTFQKMSQNDIQFARMWLSQWGIFSSAWNPWNSIVPGQGDQYIPFEGMTSTQPNISAGSETSMIVNTNYDPCMFVGWLKARPAVKPNTNYRVRIRYLTENIEGPRIAGHQYGLVAKLGGDQNGGWLWGDGLYCHDPGTGIIISEYEAENTLGTAEPYQTIEGIWNSGNNYYLPFFYVVMENVDRGRARIDYVWFEEDLGNGKFGANILSKPWMSHHLYFEQRNSFAFDQVIELAHKYDIYLRPVLLEKNEWVMNRLTPSGAFDDPNPTNDNFYGNWREVTKARWLQRAWWRYIQARWGYSPNIHSWELLNEGDPGSTRHYTLTDELGKFMNCVVFDYQVAEDEGSVCDYDHPNAHPVSTSFWHSFPAEQFWANIDYPNVDFADIHAYISTGWLSDPVHVSDSAAYHLDYSRVTRDNLDRASVARPTKPIVRGEAGIDFLNKQVEQPDLALDQNGVWLHNFLWASLDEGGLVEQYWWTQNIETQPGPDGKPGLHEIFAYFGDFLGDIPLNNGNYRPAEATTDNQNLRIVGQMDLINHRAHLWVQNKMHTWRNAVNTLPGISGLSGTVRIEGFQPNDTYTVEWYQFTTQGKPTMKITQTQAGDDGALVLILPSDPQVTDVGVKIGN